MTRPCEFVLHVDGGARGNPGPAAAGVVLQDRSGRSLLEAGYLLGVATNNQAEYGALLLGLQAALRYDAEGLTIYSDSELMVRQLLGQYRVKSAELKPRFEAVQRLLLKLQTWTIRHVNREENSRADELLNRALDLGGDVVEVESGEASAAAGHADAVVKPSPAAAIVEVIEPGPKPPCSDACAAGAHFVVERVLPVGLSLDAAAKLISAINQLRSGRCGPAPAASGCRVSCGGCGAVFAVSLSKRGA